MDLSLKAYDGLYQIMVCYFKYSNKMAFKGL